MTDSVRAAARYAPSEPPSGMLAGSVIQQKLLSPVTRRDLLQRTGFIAAAGVATMVLKAGPVARTSAHQAATTTAAASTQIPDHARFMELVGTAFLATSIGGAALTQRARLTLEEVVLLGETGDPGRPAHLREVPYALRFIVSAGELARSGIVRLESVDRERVDAFIHQIGMQAPGADIRYEAVFN